MNSDEYVPTLTEIWDFLIGFKEATEAGFNRLTSDVAALQSDVTILKSDVTILKSDVKQLQSDMQRMDRRLMRMDDRLADLEGPRILGWLNEHERRITQLEQRPS